MSLKVLTEHLAPFLWGWLTDPEWLCGLVNDWEDAPSGWLGGSLTLHVGHCAWPPSFGSDPPSPSFLCIPGLFITYVLLKSQKVTKKAQ